MPAAIQKDAEVQDTPDRKAPAPAPPLLPVGLGLGTIDHELPFHVSAREEILPDDA